VYKAGTLSGKSDGHGLPAWTFANCASHKSFDIFGLELGLRIVDRKGVLAAAKEGVYPSLQPHRFAFPWFYSKGPGHRLDLSLDMRHKSIRRFITRQCGTTEGQTYSVSVDRFPEYGHHTAKDIHHTIAAANRH